MREKSPAKYQAREKHEKDVDYKPRKQQKHSKSEIDIIKRPIENRPKWSESRKQEHGQMIKERWQERKNKIK